MRISVAALAYLVTVVSAQTWSECNPTKKDTCPPNPALAGTYKHVYGKAAPDFNQPAMVSYGSEGAIFRVEKSLDSPTLISDFYIMFGKLEVKMKAAPGAGIISSLVLQSDTLDEIDWEWIGSDSHEVQTNYFGKGDTSTYDRGATHEVSAHEWHTYGVDWTPESVKWTIDGKVVRTLFSKDKPDIFPQSPCQIRMGSWSGGDSKNAPGVIKWAKGPTDYSKGPYDMIVAEFSVVDYSSGTEYVYTDRTGAWKSIKAVGGKVYAGPQTGKGNQGEYNTPTNTQSGSSPTGKPAGGSRDHTDDDESSLSGGSPSGSSGNETQKGTSPNPVADIDADSAANALTINAMVLGAIALVMGWAL